jgi:2'-hydroxyisoflavone reductase
MHLLVLGGTVFLGRHLVEAALAGGHQVTVFNRGTHAIPFADHVESLRGDRNGDVKALLGRRFDAVIDCCGYTPEQLIRTADALGSGIEHYVFVSTISVLAGFAPHTPYDETAPVTTSAEGYGGGKARAEDAIEAAYPGRVTHVRPGLIVGPHDPTGRFVYWPLRVAQGGIVLAPGRPQRQVQIIDVRDLAQWCVNLAQRRHAGVLHAVGPMGSMAQFLESCRLASDSDATWQWFGDAELLAAQVNPWMGLPLWIPEDDAESGGLLLGRNDRAVAVGLVTRPWVDTARDTLAWARAAGLSTPATALQPKQERDLLATRLKPT